jgi:uncharacterized protein YpbB
LFQGILHHFVHNLTMFKDTYSYTKRFVHDLDLHHHLTTSTKKTLHLISEGKTINDITKIRSLKRSTIEDHVVELAIHHAGFDSAPYVNSEQEKMILGTVDKLKTKRLREIKTALDDAITYFQIRLVLAKNQLKDEKQ